MVYICISSDSPREVMEGPDPIAEEAVCGGGREAAGSTYAGLPELQVPSSQKEATKTNL